jgi:hypothetical protein
MDVNERIVEVSVTKEQHDAIQNKHEAVVCIVRGGISDWVFSRYIE